MTSQARYGAKSLIYAIQYPFTRLKFTVTNFLFYIFIDVTWLFEKTKTYYATI